MATNVYQGIKGLRNIANHFNVSMRTLQTYNAEYRDIERAVKKAISCKGTRGHNLRKSTNTVKMIKPVELHPLWAMALGIKL